MERHRVRHSQLPSRPLGAGSRSRARQRRPQGLAWRIPVALTSCPSPTSRWPVRNGVFTSKRSRRSLVGAHRTIPCSGTLDEAEIEAMFARVRWSGELGERPQSPLPRYKSAGKSVFWVSAQAPNAVWQGQGRRSRGKGGALPGHQQPGVASLSDHEARHIDAPHADSGEGQQLGCERGRSRAAQAEAGCRAEAAAGRIVGSCRLCAHGRAGGGRNDAPALRGDRPGRGLPICARPGEADGHVDEPKRGRRRVGRPRHEQERETEQGTRGDAPAGIRRQAVSVASENRRAVRASTPVWARVR